MSRIITTCSFRAGAGKTTITANLAAQLIAQGKNVCVVDANLRTPDVHNLFNLEEQVLINSYSLADFLYGLCSITDTVHAIPTNVSSSPGLLYLVSALGRSGLATKLAHEGYNLVALRDGLESLFGEYNLDYILIDTYAGMDERTLPLIALADVLLIVMVLDKQDFQGTGVIVDVAHKFDVPDVFLVINSVALAFEDKKIREEATTVYKSRVAAIIPYDLNMLDPDQPRSVSLARMDTPVAVALRAAASEILALPDFEEES